MSLQRYGRDDGEIPYDAEFLDWMKASDAKVRSPLACNMGSLSTQSLSAVPSALTVEREFMLLWNSAVRPVWFVVWIRYDSDLLFIDPRHLSSCALFRFNLAVNSL